MKRDAVNLEEWFERAVDWYASRRGLDRKAARALCVRALERGEMFRGLDAAAEAERAQRAQSVGKDINGGAFVEPGAL